MKMILRHTNITPDDNNIECFIANEKQNGFLFIVGHSQYPENGNISSTMRFDIAIPDIYGDISPRSYQTEWELPETNKKNSIAYGRCIVVDDGNGPVQIDSEDNFITVVVDTVTGASHILKE